MSAKYRFVKGPWKAEIHRAKVGEMQIIIKTAYDVYDGDKCLGPLTICTIEVSPTALSNYVNEEWEATGHFIAAAPEMFELLKLIDRFFTYFYDAAIDPVCEGCDYSDGNVSPYEFKESCKSGCDWGKFHNGIDELLSQIRRKCYW